MVRKASVLGMISSSCSYAASRWTRRSSPGRGHHHLDQTPLVTRSATQNRRARVRLGCAGSWSLPLSQPGTIRWRRRNSDRPDHRRPPETALSLLLQPPPWTVAAHSLTVQSADQRPRDGVSAAARFLGVGQPLGAQTCAGTAARRTVTVCLVAVRESFHVPPGISLDPVWFI
jgi:hypothetical protein